MELPETTFCRGRTRDNRDCLRRTTHLSRMCPDHRSKANKALESFLRESNRIENIRMGATPAQRRLVEQFLGNDLAPTVNSMCQLAQIFQPDAELRLRDGCNVRVGRYYPPAGGPEMYSRLERLLDCAEDMGSYELHVAYEKLHPFTDGNGRTGRVLWLWKWTLEHGPDAIPPSFLHQFYYQALDAYRA